MHKRAIDNWGKIVKRVETACHFIASGKVIILIDDPLKMKETLFCSLPCNKRKNKL